MPKSLTLFGIQVPVMFVAHSMGGLLFKEVGNISKWEKLPSSTDGKQLYVTGINHDAYKDQVRSICAVFFLGTPHDGSAIADVLVRLFRVVGRGAEPYVKSLRQNSGELQKLNIAFRDILSRHFCRDLHVASFYEMHKTRLWLVKRVMMRARSVCRTLLTLK